MSADEKNIQNVERNSKGHFLPGRSGNPKGVRAGPTAEKRMAKDMLNSALPSVVEKVIKQALDYDCRMSQKMILDRCLPTLKAHVMKVKLETHDNFDYTNPDDLLKLAGQITHAIADGEIEKEQAEILISSLNQNIDLLQKIELPKRIKALEDDGDPDKN